MLQRRSKEDAHYGQNTLQELIFITSYMNFILVQKICFQKSFSGRWETWSSRNVLPFWQYCRNKHFDQYLYYGQNWYFCQIDIFVKIDIFIKLSHFRLLTCLSIVFDIFINIWCLCQLLTLSSTLWLKYQLVVPVNCNFTFWVITFFIATAILKFPPNIPAGPLIRKRRRTQAQVKYR